MKIKDMSATLTGLLNQQNQSGLPAMSSGYNGQPDDSLPDELTAAPVFSMNYKSEYKQCIKRAKDSILVIVKEVVPTTLQKSPLIIDKISQDAETLGNLYYQMKKKEITHLAMMDMISRGDCNMKLFEMFDKISKSIEELQLKINEMQNDFRKYYIDTYQDMQNKEDADDIIQEYRARKAGLTYAPAAGAIDAPQPQIIEPEKKNNTMVGTEETIRGIAEKKRQALMAKYKEEHGES